MPAIKPAISSAIRITGSVAIFYGALVALLYFVQGWLIFPGSGVLLPASELPPAAERLTLETSSGVSLSGWRLPTVIGDGGGAAATIIGFGGNGWSAEATAVFLASVFPESDVVVFHYRGYGRSGGETSAAAILEDSLSIHDYVQENFGGGPVISVGVSIGSGPATHIARHRNITGMLLITPFDSIEAVAKDKLFWIPVSLLLRHHMNPVEEIQAVSIPVAVIAASDDEVIPPARTRALQQAVPNLVFSSLLEGVGHNNIYNGPDLREAMATAVAIILSEGDPE